MLTIFRQMGQAMSAPNTNGPPPIDQSLPFALLRAREAVMAPIRPMLAELDLTEQQWRVLRVVDERGVTEAGEVARLACLMMPSLTRIIRVLEDRALLERLPHETDKRRVLLDYTGRVWRFAPKRDPQRRDRRRTGGTIAAWRPDGPVDAARAAGPGLTRSAWYALRDSNPCFRRERAAS